MIKDKAVTYNDKRGGFLTSILFRRLTALIVTAGLCGAFIWLILLPEKGETNAEEKVGSSKLRPVTVIKIQPQTYQTNIEAYGEVTPEWKVAVKSKVQGEILEVSDTFRKGNSVKKGELLVAVEQADYRVQLKEAALGLKEAGTKLLIEQKEGLDARKSWERSGLQGAPSSALLLRKPYLESAQANLEAAKSKLRQAELLMEYTQIRAPFDALVVARNISLGETLFAGDEVGVLYGMNTFVISLQISSNEWTKLPEDWRGTEVRLSATDSNKSWRGTLIREGKLIERDSRLRSLFVEIDHPLRQSPPLLPGTFVKADIPGRLISGLLRVPDSARTSKGLVWYVDGENRLQSIQAAPVFREKGYLYFRAQNTDLVTVVINPNDSFVNGLQVTPFEGNPLATAPATATSSITASIIEEG